MPGVLGGQEIASHSLELESQMAVNLYVGAGQ